MTRQLPAVQHRAGRLTGRLALLTAAGSLTLLPTASQAGPAVNVADCLRPGRAVASAASPVLLPPAGSGSQLLAQALPAASPQAPVAGPVASGSAPGSGAAQLLAQTPAPAPAAGPETLPACTYDPPRPAAPQIIRGLW